MEKQIRIKRAWVIDFNNLHPPNIIILDTTERDVAESAQKELDKDNKYKLRYCLIDIN